MKLSRAIRLMKENKARIRYDRDLGTCYLVLRYDPSGEEMQPIHLGIDPGSWFDGMSLVSKKCHLFNLQLIHNKGKFKKRKGNKKPDPTGIVKRLIDRSDYRKLRRHHLRQREVRNKNRTGSKLPPSINSMVEFRIYAINKLSFYFPISKVIVEDVCFNHFKSSRGSSFSQAEIGKTKFYQYITDKFGACHLTKGSDTAKARRAMFVKDPKASNKSDNSFYAHCIDSFVIANAGIGYAGKLVEFGRSIEKQVFFRRNLYQLQTVQKNSGLHERHRKGGVLETYQKIGRRKVSWVQVEENNFVDFKLLINGQEPKDYEHKCQLLKERDLCFHKFKKKYGGTVVDGVSKYQLVKRDDGVVYRLGSTLEIRRYLKSTDTRAVGYSNRNLTHFDKPKKSPIRTGL